MSYSICAAGTAPAGLDLPADFNVTYVARCTSYFFGVAHDRTLNFSEVTRSGPVTYTRWLAFPTDAEGRPSKAFYLDDLVILILACCLILSEWKFGTTLGKRILGMHVQPVGGGPMTATGALTRTLVYFIPMYPFLLLMVMVPFGPTGLFAMGHFVIILVGVALAIVFLLNFILAVRRANLPWHDRWAGTEVVRDHDVFRHIGARTTSPASCSR